MTAAAMNTPLRQLAQWLPLARNAGDGDPVIARVHTDTRTLQAGDLFVALKGERFDAADFLVDAAARGAAAVLCNLSAAPQLAACGLPGILVPDSGAALAKLARAWRLRFGGPLIAVTGSNGKTTTTQMIGAILHAWEGDAALATQGNFNNAIGVPLTLLRLRATHRAAVVELGMNHPSEISYLGGITQPTVALVTNAQREHQEFMATVDAVARENGSVFLTLAADGRAVYPADDAHAPLWAQLAGAHESVTFGGEDSGAAVTLQQTKWQGDHWQVQANTPAGALKFALHAPGRHNVRNALAAVASAWAAGAPLAACRQGLEAFRPVAGRSRLQVLRIGGRKITLVDDTYNANPDSVRALIDVLAELPAPRLLVLGDMGEVGANGPAFHAEVGAYARERGVQDVLTLGTLAIHTAMAAQGRHFDTLEQLLAAVRTHLGHSATVAVKGSRFMHMERVVQALQESASDKPGAHHVA